MSRGNRRKTKEQIVKYECSLISQERMIEIQTEAYYRALKKIEQEKAESKLPVRTKKNMKWYVQVLFALNVIFFPWKINKKFNINNRIYDSILVFFVSGALQMIGGAIWLFGIITILYEVYRAIIYGIFDTFFALFFIAIFSLLFGSIFVLSGDKFSQEMDSYKIYAYSSSVIALISCAVSIIALLLKI